MKRKTGSYKEVKRERSSSRWNLFFFLLSLLFVIRQFLMLTVLQMYVNSFSLSSVLLVAFLHRTSISIFFFFFGFSRVFFFLFSFALLQSLGPFPFLFFSLFFLLFLSFVGAFSSLFLSLSYLSFHLFFLCSSSFFFSFFSPVLLCVFSLLSSLSFPVEFIPRFCLSLSAIPTVSTPDTTSLYITLFQWSSAGCLSLSPTRTLSKHPLSCSSLCSSFLLSSLSGDFPHPCRSSISSFSFHFDTNGQLPIYLPVSISGRDTQLAE